MLMIMASHQTFSGQLWHLTDQTKFAQTNLLYIINGEVNECIIGKRMSRQFSTLIISTENMYTRSIHSTILRLRSIFSGLGILRESIRTIKLKLDAKLLSLFTPRNVPLHYDKSLT